MRGGTQKMPSLAKAYIAIIAAVATDVLMAVVARWTPENFGRFFLFFALAMVASEMKIRLPGFESTISINFVFILIGIALFSFSETVLIGLGGALVQSLWKTRTRPKLVQVLFNSACLTVCTAAAFWASHGALAMLGLNSLAAMMVLGACLYVVLNTGLVSLVISLAEGRPLREIWSSCYEWTFPYFLVGAAMAGFGSAPRPGAELGGTRLLCPRPSFFFCVYPNRPLSPPLLTLNHISPRNT